MNFLYSEIGIIFKIDILRLRTKIFLFLFNILPDLYLLKIMKNFLLCLAGAKISLLFTYIKNGLYCDNLTNLKIGKGSFLNAYIYLEGNGKITIGKACQIGPSVKLLTTNHTNRENDEIQNITIGDNVWIGAGCIILPGTIIHDNMNIAAGSILKGDVQDGVLWAGTLAKKKK
ncbi:acyltransferase [Sulfurospirillum arsenophilum]|uniref:acyltransferase n=1 Tax=Sulfurospirillum arsenophilum TaxID=56698 RepID=UPI00069470A4|nr:acyltransferase [Sulfurospirillum arsenophilum]